MSHDSIFIKRFVLNLGQLVPNNYFKWSLFQTVKKLSYLIPKSDFTNLEREFVLLPNNLSFTYTIIISGQQSCSEIMFSVMCVCHSVKRGPSTVMSKLNKFERIQ